MQIITGELSGHTSEYPLSRFGGRKNILAVDIETTGLSSAKDRIYLIGCGYWEDGSWKLIQWFDDRGDGEADILTSFLLFSKKFTTLMHYNGRQFDLPFLARRIVWNGLQGIPGAEDFPSAMKSLDLYRYLKPYQKFLALPDLKQQTVERFLNTGRTENRSGGDLVKVYLSYTGAMAPTKTEVSKERDLALERTKRIDAAMINRLLQEQARERERQAALQEAADSAREQDSASPFPDTADAASSMGDGTSPFDTDSSVPAGRSRMRTMLLAHNSADVAGLVAMTDILMWRDLFQANLSVYRAQANTYHDADGEPQQELIMYARAENVPEDIPVPAGTASLDGCYCAFSGNKVVLKVPIFSGRLHYYYANYKDYYYLPELDQAVHKSIASYVDPKHREQARADNCYTGKVGSFLPEWTKFRTPVFLEHYRDQTAWFEFKAEMKKDKAFFAEYATYVYRHILKG